MKKIRELLVAVFLVLGMVSLAQAQITTTSTTLSTSVDDTNATTLTVASATGFTAGTTSMFVDRELMAVTSVSGTTIGVRRGAGGRVSTHASAATVYVGPTGRGPFILADKYGSCTATDEPYLRQINPNTGNQYDCQASLWVIVSGPASAATGLTALTVSVAGTTDVGVLDAAFRTAYLTSDINFEGSTANTVEAIVRHADPTVADVVQTIPDTAGVADTFAMLTLPQTMASKTLTAPTLTGTTAGAALTLSTTLGVTGITTPTGGIASVPVGSPIFYADTGIPLLGTAGTATTGIANQLWYTQIFIPVNMTITNAAFLCGTTCTTDKAIVAIYTTAGTLLANSATAGGGTTLSGASTWQKLALTAPLAVTGPGKYIIGVTTNGTTAADIQTAPLLGGVCAVAATQVPPATFSPVTTVTTNSCPFMYVN